MLSVGLSADNGMKFGEFPLLCVTIGLNGPVRGILLTNRLRLRSAFAARLLTRANLNSTATCSFPGSFEIKQASRRMKLNFLLCPHHQDLHFLGYIFDSILPSHG
jgi:hypothetical protein